VDVVSSVVRVPVGQGPSTRATSGGIVLGLVGGRAGLTDYVVGLCGVLKYDDSVA
jgi:hypothetical protein